MPTVSEQIGLVSPLSPIWDTTAPGLRPRLLFLASTESRGGIERHAVQIAAALTARGASVEFACPPDSFLDRACCAQGLPTLPFRARNSGDLTAALHLAHLIWTRQAEIVHAHSRRDYFLAVLAVALAQRSLLGRRPRLILHAHMLRPLGGATRPNRVFFERGADAVIAVSDAVAALLKEKHRFRPGFVRVIHNGVALPPPVLPGSLEAARRRQAARQVFGIPPEAPTLGMVGRLDAKGQAHLLEAAPALAASHPALRLVFLGGEGKPGEQERLTAQAAASGLEGRLTFLGERDDVAALLPGLDVLVHLPRDESFGLALAEAMAAGLPTVATDIGGCREVVQPGVTGLLVPPGDAPALLAVLRFLLDPEEGLARRTEMGLAGRRAAEKNFSEKRQIDSLLVLYHQLHPQPVF